MRGDGRILERLDRIEDLLGQVLTVVQRIEADQMLVADDLTVAHSLADHAGPFTIAFVIHLNRWLAAAP